MTLIQWPDRADCRDDASFLAPVAAVAQEHGLSLRNPHNPVDAPAAFHVIPSSVDPLTMEELDLNAACLGELVRLLEAGKLGFGGAPRDETLRALRALRVKNASLAFAMAAGIEPEQRSDGR
jgi:hypothetical protein